MAEIAGVRSFFLQQRDAVKAIDIGRGRETVDLYSDDGNTVDVSILTKYLAGFNTNEIFSLFQKMEQHDDVVNNGTFGADLGVVPRHLAAHVTHLTGRKAILNGRGMEQLWGNSEVKEIVMDVAAIFKTHRDARIAMLMHHTFPKLSFNDRIRSEGIIAGQDVCPPLRMHPVIGMEDLFTRLKSKYARLFERGGVYHNMIAAMESEGKDELEISSAVVVHHTTNLATPEEKAKLRYVVYAAPKTFVIRACDHHDFIAVVKDAIVPRVPPVLLNEALRYCQYYGESSSTLVNNTNKVHKDALKLMAYKQELFTELRDGDITDHCALSVREMLAFNKELVEARVERAITKEYKSETMIGNYTTGMFKFFLPCKLKHRHNICHIGSGRLYSSSVNTLAQQAYQSSCGLGFRMVCIDPELTADSSASNALLPFSKSPIHSRYKRRDTIALPIITPAVRKLVASNGVVLVDGINGCVIEYVRAPFTDVMLTDEYCCYVSDVASSSVYVPDAPGVGRVEIRYGDFMITNKVADDIMTYCSSRRIPFYVKAGISREMVPYFVGDTQAFRNWKIEHVSFFRAHNAEVYFANTFSGDADNVPMDTQAFVGTLRGVLRFKRQMNIMRNIFAMAGYHFYFEPSVVKKPAYVDYPIIMRLMVPFVSPMGSSTMAPARMGQTITENSAPMVAEITQMKEFMNYYMKSPHQAVAYYKSKFGVLPPQGMVAAARRLLNTTDVTYVRQMLGESVLEDVAQSKLIAINSQWRIKDLLRNGVYVRDANKKTLLHRAAVGTDIFLAYDVDEE